VYSALVVTLLQRKGIIIDEDIDEDEALSKL
jgi:hypothetical protein